MLVASVPVLRSFHWTVIAAAGLHEAPSATARSVGTRSLPGITVETVTLLTLRVFGSVAVSTEKSIEPPGLSPRRIVNAPVKLAYVMTLKTAAVSGTKPPVR